ncbi:MAG: DUF5615 family PIN-like protein [Cytophagales bacterium]|jgi:predicted nuclease of predicted toxin-antitoxin system|nr:DUF5615 family PIN-like protein [Cytophagales bacterium]
MDAVTTLKFVADVGVGKSVEMYLQKSGYEVIAVRDINPSMPDLDILRLATEEGTMVITMNKDFGELIYSKQEKHHGVLLLRMEEATGAEKVKVVEYILNHFEQEMIGKFCVYQDKKLRIKG